MDTLSQISGNMAANKASKLASQTQPVGQEASSRRTVAFEDDELVLRCQDGDMQAFGSLVAKYQDRVYNLMFRMVGRRALAEELAQEAFLKALERIGQFRRASRFYTWLFRIAANLAISHRRRAVRVRFHSLSGPEDGDGNLADPLTAGIAERRDPGPEAMAMSQETRERISAALCELDEEFRIVVVLRDREGLDYAEIAEVLDLPVGTVKSRLHRGRNLLREKLIDLID